MCPSSYGVSLDKFARLLEEDVGEDPTLLIAIYLGLAYQQVEKMIADGLDLSTVLLPSLERAWRENLFIRHSEEPGTLDDGLLTKYGAINATTTSDDPQGPPDNRDAEDQDQLAQGNNPSSYKTRYRRRRVVKPRGSKRSGGKGIYW